MATITDISISNLISSAAALEARRAGLVAENNTTVAALSSLVTAASALASAVSALQSKQSDLTTDVALTSSAAADTKSKVDAIAAQIAPPVQQQVLIHTAGGITDVGAGKRTTVRLRFTLGQRVTANCKPFVHLYQNDVWKGDLVNHSARLDMDAQAPGSKVEFDWVAQVPANLPAGFYMVSAGIYLDDANYTLIPQNFQGAPGVSLSPSGNEQYYIGGIQVGAYVAPTDNTDVTVFPNGNYVLPVARNFV